MPTIDAATHAVSAAIQLSGPLDAPNAWKTASAVTVPSANCDMLKKNLSGLCRWMNSEGNRGAEQVRDEQPRRRHEEQADDDQDLVEREGVGLTPELEVEGVELGDDEAGGEDRPRDADRVVHHGRRARERSEECRRRNRHHRRQDP